MSDFTNNSPAKLAVAGALTLIFFAGVYTHVITANGPEMISESRWWGGGGWKGEMGWRTTRNDEEIAPELWLAASNKVPK